ncbi:MAG TPA: substrate-binding domain-containing protein [Victivallales bacterium]|nr:substrate-binding domain-containing protein [Victivallales bacterium]HPO90644.1 substrate-binding domain-containing protein [Victivallales bacterium]HRU00309.1 substrate-binding domain-containing protein [Victivallales bacterium]
MKKKLKVVRITDEIRKLIDSKCFDDNAKLPSERRLAKLLGTTQVTINKALTLLQNEGTIVKKHGSGNYVLRRSKYVTINFLIEEIGQRLNPIWYSIYEAFYFAASLNKGVKVKLDIIPKDCHYITREHFENADILISGIHLYPERVESILSHNIPVIWLQEYPEPLDGAFVCFDNFTAGKMAAEHLISTGCKKLLYVTFSMSYGMSSYGDYTSDLRFDGFRRGVVDFGMNECSLQFYSCFGDFSKFIPELYPFFTRENMVDGILTFADHIALYPIRAAKKAGRRIPEDLRIVGIDGQQLSEIHTPSLTTLRQPTEEIGKRALETAISILNNKPYEKIQKFKPELIIRESTSLNANLKGAENLAS